MANIVDNNCSFLAKLILFPNKDEPDWITYEMIICSADEKKVLLKLSQSGLFLEACIEQEVLTIYYEIQKLIFGKESKFVFEPMDQKEFRLEIDKISDEIFFVGIYSEFFKIFGIYEWNYNLHLGVKFLAKKEALLSFIEQLKREYEEIKPGPKLIA